MMPPDDPVIAYRAQELECAKNFFGLRASRGNSLLEIGAGTGHQARHLFELGFEVAAIDLNDSPYRDVKVFPITIYDGRHLPFATASFDLIYSSNVLEHASDLNALLLDAARVLKPGGLAVHIMPTSAWRLWSLVTHFPWIIKRTFFVALGKASTSGEFGRPKARKGLLSSIASIIPRRHGEHGTLLGELWSYRRQRWIQEICKYGLLAVSDQPAGLFYTGSQLVGGRMGMAWRRRIARLLGSAVRVYVFQKPPSTPKGSEAVLPNGVQDQMNVD